MKTVIPKEQKDDVPVEKLKEVVKTQLAIRAFNRTK